MTLQLGHYTNFTGTHWWNIQVIGGHLITVSVMFTSHGRSSLIEWVIQYSLQSVLRNKDMC